MTNKEGTRETGKEGATENLAKEEGTIWRKRKEWFTKIGRNRPPQEEGTILLQKGKSDRLGNQMDKKKKERCRRG